MNKPEYILTDEMATIITATKAALQANNVAAGQPAGWPVLNYQYGYRDELNETLKQYEEDPTKYDKKFPLVWFIEPYTIEHGIPGIYGNTKADIIIFNTTDKTWKAAQRTENNYKPVIWPIRRELINQIVLSVVFDAISVEKLKYKERKIYFWEAQRELFSDAVDYLAIVGLDLSIHNNQNCTPFKSF